jgi:exportin-1
MERLLNFEAPLDIGLLDAVMAAFYSSDKSQRETANAVLTQFQEHSQAWTKIMPILTNSQDTNTRFFALRILEKVIKSSWKDFNEQKQSIMNSVVDIIMNLTSSEQLMKSNKLVLQKCNQLLVQILVREFPNWGRFIQNLLSSAFTSTASCQNCMEILKLLGEELIERSGADGQLPEATRNQVELQPHQDLCYIVTEMGKLLSMSASNFPLASAILEALSSYLDLVPIAHVIRSVSLDLVISFLLQPISRVAAAKWLIDFVTVVGTKRDKLDISILAGLFTRITAQVMSVLPCKQEEVNRFYKSAPKFLQNLAVLFVTVLKEFASLNTTDSGFIQSISAAQSYIFLFSLLRNKETVKICLDYWWFLLAKVYKVRQTQGAEIANTLGKALLPSFSLCHPLDFKFKLSSKVVNGREEVSVAEIEEGEEVDDEDEEDLSSLFNTFREIYVFLAHIYPKETGELVLQGLQSLASGQWSLVSLCGLSWVVGCVGEAYSEVEQQQLLTPVLSQLLVMRNSSNAVGSNNVRMNICACLLYILAHSPRFVQSSTVLPSAISTCFECMNEPSNGVKDMACHALLSIAQKCKVQLCCVPISDPAGSGQITITEYVVNTVLQIGARGVVPLGQTLLLYQAAGYSLSGFIDPANHALQQALLNRVLETATDAINVYYGCNANALLVKATINGIVHAIHAHAAVALPLRAAYSEQFKKIFQDLVRIYIAYCEIPATVTQQGTSAVRGAYASALRVKKEILKLFVIFSEGCSETDAQGFSQQLSALGFQNSALNDFSLAPPETKPIDLLSLATVWIKRNQLNTETASIILYGLLKPSTQVLSADHDNHVPLAVALWKLLIVFCDRCSLELFTADFQTFYDTMLLGTLHQHKTSSENGTAVLLSLLQHLPELPPNIQALFLQNFYAPLLRHVLSMLVNVQYMALFPAVSTSLYLLACSARDHSEYTQGYTDIITTALESPTATKDVVRVAFDPKASTLDITSFKHTLREFTTKLPQFAHKSTFDLWREEHEKQAELEKEERQTFIKSVPGMDMPKNN